MANLQGHARSGAGVAGVVVLGEPLTARKCLGVVLAVLSIYLIAATAGRRWTRNVWRRNAK